MFCWRITKYDLRYRNDSGAYTKNEWISYSDIGNVFDGKVFTYEEYVEIEKAYITSIILFMTCNNLENLQIINLEKKLKLKKDTYVNKEIIAFFDTVKEGLSINKQAIALLAWLVLREKLWCKLESKSMFVHFGWDYYLYIGSANTGEESIQKIRESGLFVEKYKSPYSE
jgi:hypothetical protein